MIEAKMPKDIRVYEVATILSYAERGKQPIRELTVSAEKVP